MLVYHYCSMETFKSIIENKTLRLTDITKSYDSAEVKRFLNNNGLQNVRVKESAGTYR